MADTSNQYNDQIEKCRELFINKMHDYGSAWRILRLPSLTDQIFIKAQRIRGLQENEVRKIEENETSEFIGIVNYSIMALIQLEKGIAEQPDFTVEEATQLYDEQVAKTKQLMLDKNHDYGEAWRDMRVSSLTDLILQKLLRVFLEKKGCINFLPKKSIKIKTSRITSFVNDSHGVSFMASPKQPQSVTLLKYAE